MCNKANQGFQEDVGDPQILPLDGHRVSPHSPNKVIVEWKKVWKYRKAQSMEHSASTITVECMLSLDEISEDANY